MINVGVVFGGKSVEHEVSVITGMQIVENMDTSKYNPIPIFITKEGKWLGGEGLKDFSTYKKGDYSSAKEVFFKGNMGDYNLYTVEDGGLFNKGGVKVFEKIDVVLPALHGTYGEDGAIQGYFETIGIPYAGSGVLAAAVGMDKVTMKKVFKAHNIPMTDFVYFYRSHWENNSEEIIAEIETMGYPIFVKPSNLGSSIGISKANNREELLESIEVAKHYDTKILAEKAAIEPREINMAVMGFENNVITSPCEEPLGWKDMLGYDEKYFQGSKSSKRNIPANITPEMNAEIERLAKESFVAIDAAGTARIDFLIEEDKVFVNEINTLPGSISFYLWEAEGISITELISKLIELGISRNKQKSENIYSYDSDLYNNTGYGAKL